MQHQYLDEPVDVTVLFSGRRVRPIKVIWGRTVFVVDKLNLVHSAREGLDKVFFFSVSSRDSFMQLRLNCKNLEWRLIESFVP
ncbi:MAG: hypothetical protein AAB833_02410 [Patescibacteria group bacterium]